MAVAYFVTVLLDVNSVQDVDDRAESRSYIVADRESGAAAIIDAILENVERDTALLNELNLTLAYALETHIHADHITGACIRAMITTAASLPPSGEEKRFNERLNLSIDKAAFATMMGQRRTPLPARMDIAIPANMRAGRMAEVVSDRQPTSR